MYESDFVFNELCPGILLKKKMQMLQIPSPGPYITYIGKFKYILQ